MTMRMFRPTWAALAVLAFTNQAMAQAQSEAAPAKLERVEVTGTSIKRTDTETASPVQILRAADIARSGVTSMAELLRLLPAVTSGGQDDLTSGNGFAQGTSSASLRGLGSASTLTLINGRRMAATATADPNAGQSTLYNLNNIPLAAIERVEVVKDGASAVYGSDAIAGVVNFILKKEYRGLQMSARHSNAEQGGFRSRGASLFGGYGDFNEGGFNVMVGLDFSQRDATPIARNLGINYGAWQLNNPRADGSPGEFTDPDSALVFSPNFWRETGTGTNAYNTTTPVPPANGRCGAGAQLSTTFLANAAPICVMDTSIYERFGQASRSGNIFLRGTWNIDGNMAAAVEASFTRLENNYPGGGGFATMGSGLSQWFDPAGNRRTFRGVLPANHPDNPLFQANPANTLRVATSSRFADIPRVTDVTQDSTRLVLDLTGVNWGWDWQAGVLYNLSKREEVESGLVSAVTALGALERYRFGGNNSAEVLNLISPNAVSVGDTKVTIINAKASTEMGRLSGGAIGLALGIEHRRESIDIKPDANLNAGNFVGRGGSSATGSRNVSSAFAEVNLPVFKSLNIEAALRSDQYSDYGNSTTPKLGIKWKPFEQLALRATAADGFRAPGLTQISKSNVSSFQNIPTWRDTARCPEVAGQPTRIPGATGYESANECNRTSSAASRQIAAFIVSNPDLQPETSRSYTLGLVYAPTASFNGTFDVYQISRKNEVDRLSSANVMERFFQLGDASYANDILRSADPTTALLDASGRPIPGTERVVGVRRKFLNLGETIVRGADLELSYRFQIADSARVSSSLFLGYVKDNLFQRDKGLPFGQFADDALSNNPTYKARLSSNIQVGSLNLTGSVNYVSDMAVPSTSTTTGIRTECNPGVASDPVDMALLGGDCRVASFTTVDTGISYSPIKGLTLSATLRNLFNRRAPYDPGYTYYNNALHNAQGRTASISVSYKLN
jgi:iron complex outermembrane receptor protein